MPWKPLKTLKRVEFVCLNPCSDCSVYPTLAALSVLGDLPKDLVELCLTLCFTDLRAAFYFLLLSLFLCVALRERRLFIPSVEFAVKLLVLPKNCLYFFLIFLFFYFWFYHAFSYAKAYICSLYDCMSFCGLSICQVLLNLISSFSVILIRHLLGSVCL